MDFLGASLFVKEEGITPSDQGTEVPGLVHILDPFLFLFFFFLNSNTREMFEARVLGLKARLDDGNVLFPTIHVHQQED